MLGCPIDQLMAFNRVFLLETLVQKIQEHGLQEYDLFKNSNPLKFMIYLNNWMSLERAEAEVQALISRRSPLKDLFIGDEEEKEPLLRLEKVESSPKASSPGEEPKECTIMKE